MPTIRGSGEIPFNIPSRLRTVIQDLQQNVVKIRGQQQQPQPIMGLRATGLPLSNLIQWTAANADGYLLLWASTPNVTLALQGNPVNVGNSTQYSDNVGPGVTRWYWIQSFNIATGKRSQPTGPVKATSLVSTSGVTPPVPPPKTDSIIYNSFTGQHVGRNRITTGY
jgi:hypothetical protein